MLAHPVYVKMAGKTHIGRCKAEKSATHLSKAFACRYPGWAAALVGGHFFNARVFQRPMVYRKGLAGINPQQTACEGASQLTINFESNLVNTAQLKATLSDFLGAIAQVPAPEGA